MRSARQHILFLLILGVMVASCGYRFSRDEALPAGVERIQITILNNPTSEVGIENIITEQLITEFTRRNPSFLVRSRADADAVLSGEISSLRIWTVSRRGVQIPNERRVVLGVSLKLTSTEGVVLRRIANLSNSEVYAIDQANPLITEKNRQDAISILSQKIAETSYDLLTQNF